MEPAFLASDAMGTPLTTCNLGDPVNAYVMLCVRNNAAADRYAIRVAYGLYLDGVKVDTFAGCVLDAIPGKDSTTVAVSPVSWVCGQRVELRNFVAMFDQSATTCAAQRCNSCGPLFDPCYTCGNSSKCEEVPLITVAAPLVANFDTSFACSGSSFETVTFTDLTSGGEEPYSYTWNFGVGASPATANTAGPHVVTYSSGGSKTATLSITDSDSPPSLSMISKIFTVESCCALQVNCPADNSVTCLGDTTDFQTDSLAIAAGISGACNTPSITLLSRLQSGSCGTDPGLMIQRIYQVDDGATMVQCTVNNTVLDEVAPTMSCPSLGPYQCADDVPDPYANYAAFQSAGGTASDACGIDPSTFSFAGDVATGSCPRTIMRTYTVQDTCGNTGMCEQIITVDDTQAPVPPVPPANTTVQCPAEVPVAGMLTATDNCDPDITVSPTDQQIAGSCANNYTITRTWTFTDVCGNSSSVSQTITVDDTTPPSITCPSPVSVECSADIPPADINDVTATDNCPGVVTVTHVSDVPNGQSCPLTIIRTYRATDACGNSATCTQTITVDDQTAPTPPSPPSDANVQCAENVPTPQDLTASDNCDTDITVSPTDQINSGSCPHNFIITRTWTFTDACNNSASISQTITVNDDTPPTITCPPNTTVQCEADIPPNDFAGGNASDNCAGSPTVTHLGDSQVGMVVTRTYQATDACGNSATCIQIITIDNNAPPNITCPPDTMVECSDQVPAADPDLVTTSSACGDPPVVVHLSDVSDNQSCPETITRTYEATDVFGNMTTCTQIITVLDTTPPVPPSPPANELVQCSDEIPPPVDLTATDNCDAPMTVSPSDQTTSGSCPNSFVVTRTWTFTDACGDSSSVSQIITVDDTTPPSISCPDPVSVECFANVPAPDISAVTASDNCPGQITIVHVGDVPDGQSCPMTITRTYRATDACGNSATCTQIITVDDQTPPTPPTPPGAISVECPSQVPAGGNLTATDNCDGTLTASPSDVITSGSCPNSYSITRTWTFTDACNNSVSVSQIITVDDTTDPSITAPANVTVQCNDDLPPADFAGGSTSDNCAGSITVTHLGDVSDLQIPETITRTYQATDACSNSSTAVQMITVDNNSPPNIQCPPTLFLDCTDPIPDPDESLVTGGDACGGSITVEFISDVSDGNTCPETIRRTYEATDVSGNTIRCVQLIIIEDLTAPTVTNHPTNQNLRCATVFEPTVNDLPTAFTDPDELGATDDCFFMTVSHTDTGPFINGCQYTFERVYTVADECGNATVCPPQIFSFTFDNEPPVFSNVPADIVIDCFDPIPPGGLGNIIAFDDCSGALPVSYEEVTGTIGCLSESYQRIWTAVDGCGNVGTAIQNITRRDLTAPIISRPNDTTIHCGAAIPPANFDISDDCTRFDEEFNEIILQGSCACEYTIMRTWYAQNLCGASARDTQYIYVIDTTAPVIEFLNPALIGLENGATMISYNCDPPEVLMTDILVDDCCETEILTYDSLLAFNACDIFGYYQRWACGYVVTDLCGNRTEFHFYVEQFDTAAPYFVYDSSAASVQLDCGETIPHEPLVSIDDNCPNDPIVLFTADTVGNVESDSFAVIRTWEATDQCQNVSQLRQTIEFCGFQVDSFIATIGNIVWFDENKNGIQDQGEPGINGVTVNLYRDINRDSLPEQEAYRTTTTRTWSGRRGLYFFQRLNPGYYFVEFIPDEDQDFTLFHAGSDDNMDSDVDPATGMSPLIVVGAGEVNIAVDAGLTSLVVIPIDLTYFNGYTDDCVNRLRWATSFELNNEGFSVQRSTDGVEFVSIGFLEGKGNTSIGHEYIFTDTEPAIENYYRLEQVDADGTVNHSEILKLGRNCKGLVENIEVFPNPVYDRFTLRYQLTDRQVIDLKIFNHLGQLIKQQNGVKSKGIHQEQIDLANFPNGLYWIQVVAGSRPIQKSIIKNN